MADEIITELWKVQDAIAKEYNCDVKALVAHLRAKKREEDNRACKFAHLPLDKQGLLP